MTTRFTVLIIVICYHSLWTGSILIWDVRSVTEEYFYCSGKGSDQQSSEQHDIPEQPLFNLWDQDDAHAGWHHFLYLPSSTHHGWNGHHGRQQRLQFTNGIPDGKYGDGHETRHSWPLWRDGHHNQRSKFQCPHPKPKPIRQTPRHVRPRLPLLF